MIQRPNLYRIIHSQLQLQPYITMPKLCLQCYIHRYIQSYNSTADASLPVELVKGSLDVLAQQERLATAEASWLSPRSYSHSGNCNQPCFTKQSNLSNAPNPQGVGSLPISYLPRVSTEEVLQRARTEDR